MPSALLVDSQAILAQSPVLGAMVWADGFEKGVELRTVVEVAQVAEFVEDYVVPEFFGDAHQVEVKVDVALG